MTADTDLRVEKAIADAKECLRLREHGPPHIRYDTIETLLSILDNETKATRSDEALPRRAHVLKIEFGANTLDDLIYQLRQTATDLRLGHISSKGCSGSPSCGFTYEYSVDESWTKERYFEALDAALNPPGAE